MSYVNVTTLAQEISLAVTPAISGALSLVGSFAIVWMICRGRRYKESLKYRLLLGICLADVLQSSMYLVWSLWMPRGTPGAWGAMGNATTCNVQGFIFNVTTSGNFYNAALSGYYWLSVCHSMTDADIAKRYEKPTHLFCIVWPLAAAAAALGQDLYGPSTIGCWMTPTPLFCNRNDDVECEKGRYAYIYAWIYIGAPLIILGIFIGYTMLKIYLFVRENTRALDRYDFQHRVSQKSIGSIDLDSGQPMQGRLGESSSRFSVVSSIRSLRQSSSRRIMGSARSRTSTTLQETSLQAFLYVGAYFATVLFAFVCPNLEVLGFVNPFWTLLLQNLLYPLQGFFNVFIFLRPRIVQLRRQNDSLSYARASLSAMFQAKDHPGQNTAGSNRTSTDQRSNEIVNVASKDENAADGDDLDVPVDCEKIFELVENSSSASFAKQQEDSM